MPVAGIGTAGYMAFEQWGDQSNIDLRVDIFAFGICLYQMLCGARLSSTTRDRAKKLRNSGGCADAGTAGAVVRPD
jgi:serine/threonine protein kinase